jgi:hypothetical protein
MRWDGHVAYRGRGEVHTGFVGKPEEKRPLIRLRRRWEDNIERDFQEFGWGNGLN